ncbi:MAG TPA: DEAD/DEAH box helicase [Myxococcales bacterium]|nr:DEAD/DEAH box helicase [Myxococcales bacterium]HIL02683.1 DEAD/DEAH box helicase [Myxococcales bacterium]
MTELSELFAEVAEDIQTSIRELGWHTPTTVQAKAIPLMRGGGDLIVQAQTGSGKTGAFGIPLVEGIDTSIARIQALVMLPTRELANQVAVELTTLGRHRGVLVLPVYGGTGYAEQVDALETGVHIIVGTPGRILDHLGNGRMDLRDVGALVLDEADEMLSLGFWPDMREIGTYLPEKRQSHLFSATIPEKVRSLSRFFLTDAEFVAVDDGLSAPQQIEHYYYVCSANEKEALLARILEFEDPESAIIFCNTKADVRFITGYLSKRGFNADQISGDLAQAARERALKRIKSGELRFLVATDVAARGIDISDLSHVISYATADAPEVYVHRTGRTGRAGKAGIAISLVSGLDIGNFKHMQNVNNIEVVERTPPSESDMLTRIRERIQVKVEHEMRGLSPAQTDFEVNRLIPVVEAMATSHEGRRDLAGICAAYLSEHRPETTVPEEPNADAPPPERRRGSSDGRRNGSGRGGNRGGGRGGNRGGGGGNRGGGRGRR